MLCLLYFMLTRTLFFQEEEGNILILKKSLPLKIEFVNISPKMQLVVKLSELSSKS